MTAPIELTVYPDECDAFGHLNQASYLALFERARWELLARGPGMDVFTKAGVWPAVRRATVEYFAGAWPGDVLRFELEVAHRGRTSFTLRQRATRARDDQLVATLECLFVCIDASERPVPVPDAVVAAIGGPVRRVALATGAHLAVEERGRGEVPLLFVHGYPFDHTIWRAQLDAIDGHRLVAPDLRGFGASDPPSDGTTIATYADDLVALLDALDVREAVVCGLSMGGYVALDLARRHRERLRGLVLIDTRAEADSAEGRAGRDAAIATARTAGADAIAEAMGAKLFADGVDAAARDGVLAMMRRAPVAGIVAALGAMRDRADASALLPTLGDLPTLVMTGTEDRLVPPDAARRLAAAIPGAELIEVEGAGHLPPVERPATTTEALRHFLARVV